LERAAMGFIRWLIGSPTQPEQVAETESKGWEEAGQGRCKNVLAEYPDDHVIYNSHIEVAGIPFRKRDVFKWTDGRCLGIEWQAEPGNAHDRNAIMIFGRSERGRWHIGYMPKDIAASIARSGMMEKLDPRLARVFQSPSEIGDPYCEVVMQVTGPRALNEQFLERSQKRRAKSQPKSP
jgi:hypothetical protein